MALAFANSSVTAIWPPPGVVLAALVLRGYRVWPGVAVGALVANLTTAAPVASAPGIMVSNTLEAVVGAWLLSRVLFRPSFV